MQTLQRYGASLPSGPSSPVMRTSERQHGPFGSVSEEVPLAVRADPDFHAFQACPFDEVVRRRHQRLRFLSCPSQARSASVTPSETDRRVSAHRTRTANARSFGMYTFR